MRGNLPTMISIFECCFKAFLTHMLRCRVCNEHSPNIYVIFECHSCRKKNCVVRKKCKQQWLEICVGLSCRSPGPYFILPSAHIHPNARSINTHKPCAFIDVLLCPITHTQTYMQKLYTYITSSFSHSASDYTHSLPPTFSHVSVCLQSHFLQASTSISIHLSFSIFSSLRPCGLSRGRSLNIRLTASSLQRRHLSPELSWFLVLCDVSTCGDLTSVVIRTSHCHWAGESTVNMLLKERMSGLRACTEKHLHTHFV